MAKFFTFVRSNKKTLIALMFAGLGLAGASYAGAVRSVACSVCEEGAGGSP